MEDAFAAAGIPHPDGRPLDLGGMRIPFVWRSHRVAATCEPPTAEAQNDAETRGFELFRLSPDPGAALPAGELVPKRLALRNAEGIAAFVSGPLTVLAAIGKPVVWFLRVSTEAVLGLLRLRGEAPSAVTEEEVKAMIAEGTDAGVFHEAERDLLEGVIRFADRPLRTIMVPRHAITWIDADDPLEESLAEVLGAGHSRFPLCTGDIDKVIGFVHVKDIFELQLRGGTDLREVVRDPLCVSESIPALRMIELFRSSGTHIAMVIDEYGSLEGLVTPTDILTGIAGDLPD